MTAPDTSDPQSALDRVIAQIPEWRDRPLSIAPLSGGLTNTNYRVDVDGRAYVVRIPGASTELLSIDRDSEYHDSLAAASLGIGAQIVHYLADERIMVLEFIEGRTLKIADLHEAGMIGRVAETMRRLHAGPRFHRDFDMLRLADHYLELVARERIELPPGLEGRLPQIRQIDAALAARPLALVPCHNDLLAENFIDDTRQLRIVDFEYSGNNDPCFELGNFCQEQEYDDAQIAELVAAYFDHPTPRLVARVKLNMIVSDTTWTLWAAIQRCISKLEFDFWSYGLNRWRRAEEKLGAPQFAEWLASAQSDSP